MFHAISLVILLQNKDPKYIQFNQVWITFRIPPQKWQNLLNIWLKKESSRTFS